METQANQSAVDIGAIERELTALWQQASEEDEHGGVIRSAILNLIVYTPDKWMAAGIDEILTEITAARAGRAILIGAGENAKEPRIEAQVTSRCSLPSGSSKQVCCEQVTINASGASLAEVPSVVEPLLLSDLPDYLWWRTVPRLEDK